jgi:hypothetical protein
MGATPWRATQRAAWEALIKTEEASGDQRQAGPGRRVEGPGGTRRGPRVADVQQGSFHRAARSGAHHARHAAPRPSGASPTGRAVDHDHADRHRLGHRGRAPLRTDPPAGCDCGRFRCAPALDNWQFRGPDMAPHTPQSLVTPRPGGGAPRSRAWAGPNMAGAFLAPIRK